MKPPAVVKKAAAMKRPAAKPTVPVPHYARANGYGNSKKAVGCDLIMDTATGHSDSEFERY